ncbi:MAG: hypothetical protein K6F53_10545 [Lachnospiraceae bacterium]|nr:hypothetical protein [Lachnospiraceae bacterium]
MATYTRHYSHYPNEIYTPHEFRDADNSVGNLINDIKQAMASGHYDDAQRIMSTYAGTLEPYVLNTEHINMIEEETRNLEIFAKSRQQAVFYQEDEPEYAQIDDVWIS